VSSDWVGKQPGDGRQKAPSSLIPSSELWVFPLADASAQYPWLNSRDQRCHIQRVDS
jgi:hypothetical protein